MPPIEPGATSDSPTDTQADKTADTATADKQPAKSADLLSRMDERLESVQASSTEDEDPTDPAGEPSPKADPKGKKADPKGKKDEKAVEDDPESKDAAKSEPETIPYKAFQARVGKLTEQRRALQREVSESKREAAALNEALTIAGEELERYRELARNASAFDEKDEQIRANEVRERARAAKAKVDEDHQKFERTFTEQETRAANREKLEGEIEDACASFDLVEPAVLITQLRKPENMTRPVADVAREYQERILRAAGAKVEASRPAYPKTVKARAQGNAAVRHPANLDGMTARLEELQRQNT